MVYALRIATSQRCSQIVIRGQLIIRFQTWYIVSKMAHKLAHQISASHLQSFLATEKGKFHEKTQKVARLSKKHCISCLNVSHSL